MSHGNKERFSCKGIRICVDWFKNRGHKDITVFVPNWRKEASKPETPITGKNFNLCNKFFVLFVKSLFCISLSLYTTMFIKVIRLLLEQISLFNILFYVLCIKILCRTLAWENDTKLCFFF